MIRKPARVTRGASWTPGNWLPPDLRVGIHRRHGIHFRWHDPTRTHALHYSIHFTKGGIG
jgi:hypothetical protein